MITKVKNFISPHGADILKIEKLFSFIDKIRTIFEIKCEKIAVLWKIQFFSNYLIFINGGLGRVNANCIFQIRAHSALFGRLWVAPAYQTHGRNKSPRKTSWILKGFPKTSIGVKLPENKRYFISDCGKLQETLNRWFCDQANSITFSL